MRVVHVCRVAPPSVGGMEAVVAGLAAWQARAGHDVAWVTTQPDAPPATAEGVPLCRLRRVGPARWHRARGLAAALAGADVVHVHGVDGLTDQVLDVRPAGARVGVSTHGGFLHIRRSWWLKQAWLRTLTRASLRRADAIWFTSEADRAALAPARLPGEVVPDGLALDDLLGVARAPVPGRVLVPGRVDAHKGVDRLIDVLGALRPRPPDLELRVVGAVADPGLADALRARAAGRGVAIAIPGAVPREALVAELASARLAVFPSRHEGFGLALVEALAAAVPCVVQPIPAFVEKVRDGVEGWLVDLDRTHEAASRLGALLASAPVAVPAAAARARGWSWDAVGPRWDEAYRRLGEAP